MDGDRELIDEQIEYYRQRAPEYDATATPPGDPLARYGQELEASLHAFRPGGNVLEIACGTGGWTQRLLRHASAITALDSSLEMIRLARARIRDDPRVRFVEADVFAWEPEDAYDVVVFANWLSHVPPSRFDEFWDLVRRALVPSGRVFLMDEIEDAWRHEEFPQPEELAEHPSAPIVRRTLRDGRAFHVVKVFWNAVELESKLRTLGWECSVHPVGPFFWAVAA